MKLKLPELNQRIGVVLADGRLLSTRVEGAEGAELLIAPPSDHGVTHLLSVGEEIAFEWTTERGLLRGSGRVAGRVEGGVPLVRVLLDESSVIQRREFVRVECLMSLDVRVRGERVSASTLDLSGAGIRTQVPLDLHLGDKVTVVLYMPQGGQIEASSEVVRIDGGGVYALRFVEIDPREQERLVRYVFAAHRREFANLRRSA